MRGQPAGGTALCQGDKQRAAPRNLEESAKLSRTLDELPERDYFWFRNAKVFILNMKPKVYIETTIPSYLAACPSRDLVVAGNQELTREWWDERRDVFDLYISQFVLDEAGCGDQKAVRRRLDILAGLSEIRITEEASDLAEKLIREGIIPQKAAADAAHIAVAAVNEMDYLLTWNCKHIANAEIMKRIYRMCETEGFNCPVICTPAELMGGDRNEN